MGISNSAPGPVLFRLSSATLAHRQPAWPSPAERRVVSFRGFALEQLPLVRQLYLNLQGAGRPSVGISVYTCYLLLSGPVGSPKLFIHTKALRCQRRSWKRGMALGWPLTRLINFIPHSMLIIVALSVVLIITLCINERLPMPLVLGWR